MDKPCEWNLLKSIQCTSCNQVLFLNSDNVENNHTTNNKEHSIIVILHEVSSLERPKLIHLYIQCGSRSEYSNKRLIHRHSKYSKDKYTPPHPSPLNILEDNQVVVGVIDREGDLYVCFNHDDQK